MVNEATKLTNKNSFLKGGEFLIKGTTLQKGTTPLNFFIPEDLTEEQQMFGQMAADFCEQEVMPHMKKIDKGDFEKVVQLVERSGELGLLGSSLPEEFGGMEVDFNTATHIYEKMGGASSFCTTFAAHTGIGTLPILYFGTQEQKEKYLPGLASGKLKASYCLTEPGSGSDALAAKTKAILSEDGEHYIIEGQKMWISNAGFADVFIVFAQVDGDKFTGFIVPADLPNIELGAEEDKLGIKGSSTRQVFFQGVKVPKENVLGEIGKGHKIAFNVLNIGRFKLCAMSLGGTKIVTSIAVKYANEREQFKQPISNFGAIQNKLAEMVMRNWVCESATYRTSDLIHKKINELKSEGMPGWQAKLVAAEEYSIECAMLKVYGSEVGDYCADENVQIHGGNGFSEEYSAAKIFRDSRINRIYEGTNEINRLLTVGMLTKKAMKGDLDLFGKAQQVQQELLGKAEESKIEYDGYLAEELQAIENGKKAILMVLGGAAMKFMQKLEEQQEILMYLADMIIELFATESTILRTIKLAEQKGEENVKVYEAISKVYLTQMLDSLYTNGKYAINAFAEGDLLQGMKMGLKKYTKYKDYNVVAGKKMIAKKLIEENKYNF